MESLINRLPPSGSKVLGFSVVQEQVATNWSKLREGNYINRKKWAK